MMRRGTTGGEAWILSILFHRLGVPPSPTKPYQKHQCQRQQPTMTNKDDDVGSGIMLKIAALRELVLNNSSGGGGGVNSETTALQQERYEEKQQLVADTKKLQGIIQELQEKLGTTTMELEKERSLRKTLETTYEALAEHKKILSMQLEAISNVRNSLEEKRIATESILEKEQKDHEQTRKNLEQQVQEVSQQKQSALDEVGKLEANLLASQRLVKEIQAEKAARDIELEKEKSSHRDIIQGYMSSNESLNNRLKESEETCKQLLAQAKAAQASATTTSAKDDEERKQKDDKIQTLESKVMELENNDKLLQNQVEETKESSRKLQLELETARATIKETEASLKAANDLAEEYKLKLEQTATNSPPKKRTSPEVVEVQEGATETETEPDSKRPKNT